MQDHFSLLSHTLRIVFYPCCCPGFTVDALRLAEQFVEPVQVIECSVLVHKGIHYSSAEDEYCGVLLCFGACMQRAGSRTESSTEHTMQAVG
ncbi:hypothetical protein NQZ68_036536 [Dissostichus eleginoides]|nr:hypothetical protein NQZ68_036536 [Dissostichus eleginoides]